MMLHAHQTVKEGFHTRVYVTVWMTRWPSRCVGGTKPWQTETMGTDFKEDTLIHKQPYMYTIFHPSPTSSTCHFRSFRRVVSTTKQVTLTTLTKIWINYKCIPQNFSKWSVYIPAPPDQSPMGNLLSLALFKGLQK